MTTMAPPVVPPIAVASVTDPEPYLAAAYPQLEPVALHGLPGDIVRAIQPHTEADPSAVLLTLLAGFGAIVGPGPHAMADATQHPARIWPLIVGDTAKARKGSSYAQVRRLLAAADPYFVTERVLAGFGSGESLVDAVTSQSSDASATFDPRLFVLESEFARILNVSKREGSTLSTLLRQAWDDGFLQVRSRARTAVARGAHVVVVGHVTKYELLARLADSDAHGGLLNRFLMVGARRSQLLPAGGNLDEEVVTDFGRKIVFVVNASRGVGIMRRTPAAEILWASLYSELADDEPGGLLGAVVARDSAQVLRLSVTLALFDGCSQIDVEHLEAAAAIWRYCRRSAAIIFGELTGDTVADLILTELGKPGSAGLTKTQRRDLLNRNATAERIDQATQLLISRGLASEFTEPTGGRPRSVLCLTTKTTEDIPRAAIPIDTPYDINDINDKTSEGRDEAPPPMDEDLDRWATEDSEL